RYLKPAIRISPRQLQAIARRRLAVERYAERSQRPGVRVVCRCRRIEIAIRPRDTGIDRERSRLPSVRARNKERLHAEAAAAGLERSMKADAAVAARGHVHDPPKLAPVFG